jgi:uncharacterized protein
MKKENNPIVITAIIAGVILLIAILVLSTFSSILPASNNVITVQGTSSVKATPDLITVYYTIETKGTTSAAAKDANEVIFDKLQNSIVAAGFNKDDLKTQSYNIYPNTYWDSSSSKQKQDGYIASHSLKIEFSTDELEKLSSVIDAGANAGAGVSSINFELTQAAQNTYKAEALKLASEDAQTKADAVASGFNKKAGRLISVQISEFGYYPWNVYTASSARMEDSVAGAKEVAMNIAPSSQDITGSVSATFAIQ